MFSFSRLIFIVFLMVSLSGCVSTIIDTTVDATIAVAKIPFKVAGAAVDVVSGDEKSKDDESDDDK